MSSPATTDGHGYDLSALVPAERAVITHAQNRPLTMGRLLPSEVIGCCGQGISEADIRRAINRLSTVTKRRGAVIADLGSAHVVDRRVLKAYLASKTPKRKAGAK